MIGLSFWRWLLASLLLLPFVAKALRQKADIIRDNLRILIRQGVFIVGSGALLFYALNHRYKCHSYQRHPACDNRISGVAAVTITADAVGRRYLSLGVFIMVARADWQAVVNLEFNRGDLQVILAILFLDEELFLYHLPGAALVCAGIFLVVRN